MEGMLKTMTKILNVNRLLPMLRLGVQLAFTFFCLFAGYRFYGFYLWAKGISSDYVPRPPSVEGFLPIGALLGLKRLALTGDYETIHPAGLTIFLAAIAMGLLLRKGFCGWICPVGCTSNLAEKAGRKFSILMRLPAWIDLPLLGIKYLLLAFFLYIILWKMEMNEVIAFQKSPYNITVDAKMLEFFLSPTRLAGTIMLLLVVISFVLRNFWCRYVCPYGALLGLLALPNPLSVKRDEELCIDCKRCEKACPASIRITARRQVRNCECIGCLECLAVCPRQGCLTLRIGGFWIAPFLLPVAVLALFLGFYFIALATGHWYSDLPAEVLRKLYGMSAGFAHP